MGSLLDESVSWAEFGRRHLDRRVSKALTEGLGLERPTLVQSQGIPVALEGKDLLCRARTGSGKTLCYAVPLVQRLLVEAEAKGASPALGGLVLVPTKELIVQVHGVITSLLAFCFDVLTVEPLLSGQKYMKAELPAMLVTTPSSLLALVQQRKGTMQPLANTLRTLVVDEADLMFSFGYETDMRALCVLMPSTYQAMLVSATLSEEVEQLKGLMLHKPVVLKLEEPRVTGKLSQFYLVCHKSDKYLILYTLLKLQLVQGKILMFVKSIESAYRMKIFLERFSINSAVLNAELPHASRQNIIQAFNQSLVELLIATDAGFGDELEDEAEDEVEDEEAGEEEEQDENIAEIDGRIPDDVSNGSGLWTVIAEDGVLVHAEKELSSLTAPERLRCGSSVVAMKLEWPRLRYTLLSGAGPQIGWVTVQVKGRQLLRPEAPSAPFPRVSSHWASLCPELVERHRKVVVTSERNPSPLRSEMKINVVMPTGKGTELNLHAACSDTLRTIKDAIQEQTSIDVGEQVLMLNGAWLLEDDIVLSVLSDGRRDMQLDLALMSGLDLVATNYSIRVGTMKMAEKPGFLRHLLDLIKTNHGNDSMTEGDLVQKLSYGDSEMRTNSVLHILFCQDEIKGCVISTFTAPWAPSASTGVGHCELLSVEPGVNAPRMHAQLMAHAEYRLAEECDSVQIEMPYAVGDSAAERKKRMYAETLKFSVHGCQYDMDKRQLLIFQKSLNPSMIQRWGRPSFTDAEPVARLSHDQVLDMIAQLKPSETPASIFHKQEALRVFMGHTLEILLHHEDASMSSVFISRQGILANPQSLADCVIELAESDFVLLCWGEFDHEDGLMSGKIKISRGVEYYQESMGVLTEYSAYLP
mmetsp:Transcript_129803/g.289560  ORF Transcript_129803/g.289560 Transcript_129803/m.289560 type:complete len:868 (+) Transcript_129803:85-2688(+)